MPDPSAELPPGVDAYKTLQVDSEADIEVIQAAYRRLARKFHPDVAPGPDAQSRMALINGAWEILRDPDRRRSYDLRRAAGQRSASGSSHAQPHKASAKGRSSSTGSSSSSGGSSGSASPAGSSSARRGTSGGGSRPTGDQSGKGGSSSSGWGPDAPRYGSKPPERPPETVSRDWTSGRSTTGGGYDPATMRSADGTGAAGPPPGNPSGSVLNFGRYAGWSLGEVSRADVEYLEWLDRAPIGRAYRDELDGLLRRAGRRRSAAPGEGESPKRGLFRR